MDPVTAVAQALNGLFGLGTASIEASSRYKNRFITEQGQLAGLVAERDRQQTMLLGIGISAVVVLVIFYLIKK